MWVRVDANLRGDYGGVRFSTLRGSTKNEKDRLLISGYRGWSTKLTFERVRVFIRICTVWNTSLGKKMAKSHGCANDSEISAFLHLFSEPAIFFPNTAHSLLSIFSVGNCPFFPLRVSERKK